MMAGDSKDPLESGLKYPKMLTEINGKPMIEVVIDNLKSLFSTKNRVIFVIRKDDNDKYYLGNIIKLIIPYARVITIEKETSGAALTALLAIDSMDNSSSLLLVNGDQILDCNLQEILQEFNQKSVDSGVITFKSVHPRWSYAKINDLGLVVEVAEKNPISNNATAGFYYYKKTLEFIKYTKRMILKDAHVNGLFYICPVFNEMILDQKKIATFEISVDKYHSLMSLDKIKQFESLS
jgi:NDP-sugar pyrophosphorylase family protein